ncbi:MAG: 23S rRNA (adenine(2503)-C(2))-methyltransferase RlmN [Bacilli bacterium]|jgi:23S rRNA (adenine2503-C2)-methyltransferase|nr:23S rRNA (adenine(2503)-C(2))-methyltransferase RlmN [Bacilli bacterium]
MKYIYDLDIDDLEKLMININEKKYRAKQLFEWLYRKRISSFFEMTNLNKNLINYLSDNFIIELIKEEQVLISNDGTKKYLFKLSDNNVIETVLMKYEHGYSVCVSSQVGCNMGCLFCASGKLKKVRDLSAGEIVMQILYIQKELDLIDERISNVVVMGIGEPFDNYDNVIKFIQIINHDIGLAIGARHISVSTCGLLDKINKFSKLNLQVNLAVSLHSAIDKKRNEIMPINYRYNLNELKECLLNYQLKTNRRITFEYILLKGFNDKVEDVLAIKKFLKGLNAYINIIPFNDINDKRFKSIKRNDCYYFYQKLKDENINVTIRKDFGNDIAAACGQLRAKKEEMS